MDDYAQRLDAAKRQSVGQLLFKAARLWNEQAIARVRATTGRDVRLSHTRLLPYIDLGGTRPSEIAKRAGLTKQATGRLIAELEELGVVAREVDPEDGRAWRVVFTEAGKAAMLEGLDVLRAMEAGLAAQMG